MPLIAGIDIGNATTEVALAQHGQFIASGIVATTGMKGTRDNIAGGGALLCSRHWIKHRGRFRTWRKSASMRPRR